MSNHKIQNGEQKIINLINANVENANLTYSSIKEKIVIENKEERKENPKRYHCYCMYRYAMPVLLFLICITTIILTTSNNILLTNITLTNFVMNQEDNLHSFHEKNIYKESGLYSIIDNKINLSNSTLIELNLAPNALGEVYCAYLNKNVIKKLDNYIYEEDYKTYQKKVTYYGINEYLSKYYYYCEKENIKPSNINKNLKWVKYNLTDNLNNNIRNYELVLTSVIYTFDSVYDVTLNETLNIDLKCVVETNDVNNIEYTSLGGSYLFNIYKNESQYIDYDYLINNSARIINEDDVKMVRGIVPIRYYTYMNGYNEPITDKELEIINNLTTWLNDTKPYLLYTDEIMIDGTKNKTYCNYYSYKVIEYLIGL